MRNLIALMLLYMTRFTLWFRYRVTVKGVEHLNSTHLSKPGGVLFLPNHPTVFVDPTLITVCIWRKFPIRPMIVEYMYYTPVINWFMRFLNALPVPNFVTSSNSLKKKRADKVVEIVIEGLKNKENFLIYPAGRIKLTSREVVGGASAVHRIIQSAPEANVVLVRTIGLWGSSFSRALTGQSPPMFATIFEGMKSVFKNLLFFTPRREVTVEFMPAPADFPYNGSRMDMNRYLEEWYNQPYQTGETSPEAGEPLSLISYSRWSEVLPTPHVKKSSETEFNLNRVSADIQQKVKRKISEMTHFPLEKIQPEMHLASDLGLDSLDNAELLAFLDDQYDIAGIPVVELTTVGKVMAIAGRQVGYEEKSEEELSDLSKWHESRSKKERLTIPEGETIPEVFLNQCAKMSGQIACGDMTSGILTYSQLKTRVLLLADYIRRLPGERIGILLPSSVAAYVTILACQLAGKTPLMINWTVGPRHLETVLSLSNIQAVLSSWAFLDRLENVNLDRIEDLILTLEDVRRELSLFDKLKAFVRSKRGTRSILKLFNGQERTKDSNAVLLFTSGTENLPKGVPLSHENILSNQRDSVKSVELYTTDTLLGILPPFHSFGFTLSGLLPLLAGMKVAYSPDPTDGKGLAKAVERWAATSICGAPSFLKGIFKSARPSQLDTLRLCFTGAEKAPSELFQAINKLGHCLLIEGYGITECSPVLTANQGQANKGVGQALPSVKLCIVNLETHQPIEQGKQGLILARGPNIFSGYLNKSVSSPFISLNGQEWYSTGDLGYLDEENNLILSGRLKRFIKIGGEMVSLAAIEEALQQTIGIKSGGDEDGPTLVICAKEEAGERTRIFVFARFQTNVEELNKALRESGFSNLVKISKVQQVADIPLMGTGKVNYRALEAELTVLNDQPELTKASS